MADSALMHPWPEDGSVNHAAAAGSDRGGAGYGELLRAQRLLADRLAAARVPDDVTAEITAELTRLADRLAHHEVPESDRVDGWRPDLPGRGNALIPPYVLDVDEPGHVAGRVTFTRYHLGGNGAAHGGTQPLLFDDVLGRAMNSGLDGVARTAYLTVHYRAVTPLDVELRFEARRDSVDGRKRRGHGRLLGPDGDVLCDVECLFLQLRPGQP